MEKHPDLSKEKEDIYIQYIVKINKLRGSAEKELQELKKIYE